MIRPIVVMATVGWRKYPAEALLRELAVQTVKPREIHLLCDTPGADAPQTPNYPAEVYVHRHETPQGAGARWKFIATELEDATPVLVLDDDQTISPDYVEKSLAGLADTGAALSAWWGMHPDGCYHMGLRALERPTPLVVGHAGLTAVWPKYLRGIDQHPLAGDFLGLRGEDEAFVAWWIANNHGPGRIWRPARVPVRAAWGPSQSDLRAQSSQVGAEHYTMMRGRLYALGWPGCPALVGAGTMPPTTFSDG